MLLDGKNGLVLGIANKRSLAWGITQSVAREGARLAVTYQGERLEENVRELAAGLKDPVILPCDVSRDEDIDTLMQGVQKELGGLDFVIHAVAYALREELDGEFLNTSREGYRLARISAGSGWCRTTTSWAWPRPLWTCRSATWPPTSAPRASA